jgi:CubicO group peptidase (beta-lactamase class C family)
MMLTHCSRLNDEEESLRSDEYRTIGSNRAVTLETYVRRRICEDCDGIWSEDQPPGKADYHYSNAGFTLVGFVVEAATGIPPAYRTRAFCKKKSPLLPWARLVLILAGG